MINGVYRPWLVGISLTENPKVRETKKLPKLRKETLMFIL